MILNPNPRSQHFGEYPIWGEDHQRPDEALTWTAFYDARNDIPSTVTADDGSSLSTGARFDNFGRLTGINAIPGNYGSYVSWKYDEEGRVTQENGTKFLLDAQGLRFRRVAPDGTTTYVVYGFNREPLSTFIVAP